MYQTIYMCLIILYLKLCSDVVDHYRTMRFPTNTRIGEDHVLVTKLVW